jgi:hypothetical protein
MTRTLAIAIAALLYVLTVGPAHHNMAEEASVLLSGVNH